MSTQYIVKFIKDTVETDSYLELSKNQSQIPYITIRTHKDANASDNQTLLYKFITNNFATMTFNDSILSCLFVYKDLNNDNIDISTIIKFDSNSSSAYADFKKQFTEKCNTQYETEYYASGRVLYVGEVLYVKNEKEVVIDRIPNGTGTLYYDLDGLKIKYTGRFDTGIFDGSGTFYNMDNKISLTANNISSGIPIQKTTLNINYGKKNKTIIIQFNEMWKKINIEDKTAKKHIVLADDFITNLTKLYWDDEIPLDTLVFNDKTLDDKYTEIWQQLNNFNTKLDLINNKTNNISKNSIYKMYFLLLMINLLFPLLFFLCVINI